MSKDICAQCGMKANGMYMPEWDNEFYCWECIEGAEVLDQDYIWNEDMGKD